jgi:hypothetical protein
VAGLNRPPDRVPETVVLEKAPLPPMSSMTAAMRTSCRSRSRYAANSARVGGS